jgi:hypothetical protein
VDVFSLLGAQTDVVDSFLESQINGNTILNMFGDWLFGGASVAKLGYEVGRAEAVACLCKIFSRFQYIENFHFHYLSQFYSVIQQALRADCLTLNSCITNSSRLFVMNLDGFRVLFPEFIIALFKILPNQNHTQDSKIDSDALRKSAYDVLSMVSFSINRYSNTPVNSLPSNLLQPFEGLLTDISHGYENNLGDSDTTFLSVN